MSIDFNSENIVKYFNIFHLDPNKKRLKKKKNLSSLL